MELQTDIFNTDKERNEAKLVVPELLNHPGWPFLVRVLDLNLAALRLELETRENFKTLDELYRLQDRITDLESFKTLPATILAEATNRLPESDDDPYEDDVHPTPPVTEASAPKPS